MSSLPDILRAILSNQQAASAVQEIDFAEHFQDVVVHSGDIDLFVEAAAALGLDTPKHLLRLARRRPRIQFLSLWKEKDEILEWLTVMMVLRTPNLRRITYRPGSDQHGRRIGRERTIFRPAATATPRDLLLLPKLDEVLIEHHTTGYLWSLASMAPNLTKLRAHNQFHVPSGFRFENVTILSLRDSLYEFWWLKHLLDCFPRLQNLRYSWSRLTPSYRWGCRKCSPRELLECLLPFERQLTHLEVNFCSGIGRYLDYDGTVYAQNEMAYPRWIAFLSRSESLTHVEIDAHTFWKASSSRYLRLDPGKVGSLVEMLPKGLESVGLGMVGGDSVVLLAQIIKERCPGLRKVSCTYVINSGDEQPTKAMARKALADQGILLDVPL